MYCTNCGSNLDDKAVICPHCGCATENYYKHVEAMQKTSTNNSSDNASGNVNGYSIAALALGISSLITGFLFAVVPILGLIFSIVGLCKATNTKSGRGLAIGGLVTSVIGLIFWILYYAQVI